MSGLMSSSPYTDDAEDRQGRVAVISTEESWFNKNTTENPGGLDNQVPYPNEFCHTPEGDFVVLARDPETNAVVAKSASRDLRKKIEKLENEHIFENAEAFMFNASTNILYFDSDRMTVKISPERIFGSNYKYWAIRGVSEDGNASYYTGISNDIGDGSIISHLVNTDIVRDAEGNLIGVTCSGHLVMPLVHSNNYVVQFFDADRILIDQIAFQAYSVRAMTFDVAPENAITDIILGATGVTTGDIINLAQNASWKDLNIRVSLVYANGVNRDVTPEWVINGSSNGRVVISGLDAINSSIITTDGEDGYPITVTYFASSTNIDNPQVDPDTLSISHTYKVHIVPNKEESIFSVLPVAWIEGNSSTTSKMRMKIFGLNREDDSTGGIHFVDHTYRLKEDAATNKNGEFVSNSGFVVRNESNPDTICYELEGAINDPSGNQYEHVIQVPYGSISKLPYAFKTDASYARTHVKFTDCVNAENTNNLTTFKTPLLANVVSGSDLKTRIKLIKEGSVTTEEYASSLKASHKAFVGGKELTATHIRIRNGKNPTFWHVSTPVEITKSIFESGVLFNQGSRDNETNLDVKTPLVVEYINIQTDPTTLNRVINTVGLELYFVDSNN